MTLPDVAGWIIDFRTAKEIFDTGSNARISHCVERCESGELFICHREKKDFKSDLKLAPYFVGSKPCIHQPTEEILDKCISLAKTPLATKLVRGNESALFITATAIKSNYGVISIHRSLVFATVYDFCKQYGVPVFSDEEYFNLLW